MEQKAAPKERIIFDDNPYFGSSGDALAIEDLMNRDGLTEAKASRSASEALAGEVGVDIPQHDSYAIE